jgi:hypothetical protein
VQSKKKEAPLMNRFQLLNIYGKDDSEDEGSGITFHRALSSSALGVVA